MFAPLKSIVRNTYQKEMPSAIQITSSIVPGWSPCLQTLEGHTKRVTAVMFSPDGSRLASASAWDRTVQLWDATTGTIQQTLKGYTVAFSPDSLKLALALNSTVQLWDLLATGTGTLQQTFEDHTALVTSVAFSTDGSKLATSSKEQCGSGT